MSMGLLSSLSWRLPKTSTQWAADSLTTFSDNTREAVTMAVEEELLERRHALAATQGLQRLPSPSIEMIGTLSGLPLKRAEGINEGIDQRARRSRGNLWTNKLHFVLYVWAVGCSVEGLCGLCSMCWRRNLRWTTTNSNQEALALFRSNVPLRQQQHTFFTLNTQHGCSSALSWPFSSWVPPPPCYSCPL